MPSISKIKGPLVTIGIPVYNGERSIRHALDALLAQTYQNLELVISDNASTDRSAEICQEYAAKDPRVKYFRNNLNIDVHANYRRVVTLATGEYFMWAAADDRKPPRAVEACVHALQAQPAAVMAHGIILVRSLGCDDLVPLPNAVDLAMSDTAVRIRAFTAGITHNAMLYGLYHLEALRKVRLCDSLGEDYLLCLQMCLLGSVVYTSTPIIIYAERKPQPDLNPMYTTPRITVGNLLLAGPVWRWKCWTVLLRGCYELACLQRVPWTIRWRGIWAHVMTFCQRHHGRLAREVVFKCCEPLAWISLRGWRLAQHWTLTAAFARKVQTRLRQSQTA